MYKKNQQNNKKTPPPPHVKQKETNTQNTQVWYDPRASLKGRNLLFLFWLPVYLATWNGVHLSFRRWINIQYFLGLLGIGLDFKYCFQRRLIFAAFWTNIDKMAATEMQQQHHAFNPTLTTTQAIMPEKPRVPIVAHIITDDDIGVLKVTLS